MEEHETDIEAEIVEQSTELKEATSSPSATEQTASMIDIIRTVALNPDVPVDKLERMLAMQERVLDRQAEQDFASAMVKVQMNMPAIKKDLNNSQTNSTYANLDSMNKVIKPIYTRNGFALSFGNDGEVLPGTVRIICIVSHLGGHSRTYTYDAPIDDKGIKGSVNKTPTHARGSANTYGQRYLTKMIFNITFSDEDDDGNGAHAAPVEYLDEQQIKTLDEIIADNGIDKAAFLKYFKIDSLGDIESEHFANAKATLLKAAK